MTTTTLGAWFAGAGGDMQGAAAVDGVEPVFAANHNKLALATHAANFPDVEHDLCDIPKKPVSWFPWVALFWASPACPPWTDARGKKRDFDKSNHQKLPGFDDDEPVDDETMRGRALMEEVTRYLRYWAERGRPVLAGVVENVIQCRLWDQWHPWLGAIRALGYEVKVIAFNSMHARSRKTRRSPQSRDRLYVAYWHESLGRRPNWDKWLRPRAWCEPCDETVDAIQAWKKPGIDMGRYGPNGQYVYRCPRISCRNQIVRPEVLPAYTALDLTIPGRRIGDWAEYRKKPHAPATLARISAGLRRLSQPTPMLVPVEGRPGKIARPVTEPMRTQTARNETGIALAPFIVPLRGGGDKERFREVTDPLTTVTAGGNHHGLAALPGMIVRNNNDRGDTGGMCTPLEEPLRTLTAAGHQSLATWAHLLVPYYSTGRAHTPEIPMGTLTTRDRYGLATVEFDLSVDVDDVLFRMLEPHEIGTAMAFNEDYVVLGSSKRAKVRQYGNAVTPPVAEIIVSALVEAIHGTDFELAA